MNFQIPVQKRPVFLGFLLYTPLTGFLCLFCLNTAFSQLRILSVDRLFQTLFSGIDLSPEESVLLDSLSSQDLQVISTPWSDARKKAALLILNFKGSSLGSPAEHSVLSKEGASSEVSSNLDRVSELMESGSYEDAEARMLEVFESGSSEDRSVLGNDYFLLLRDVVMKTHSYDSWIGRVLGIEKDSCFGRSFFLATCYEKLEQSDEALIWYQKAGEVSGDWESLRRSQWYILRLMTREYPKLLAGFFDSSGVLRNDGAYFDDVLDDLFSILIRQRRWSELAALLPHIQKAGLTEAASQGLYLLEKGREEGYVTFSGALTSESLTDDPDFSPDPKGYYALRSRPESWPLIKSGTRPLCPPHADSMDEVYQYLIKAGYREESYRLWDEHRETLSLETVKSLCLYLEGTGDLYRLIRFAGFWYYTFPPDWALQLLPWVYPGSGRYTFNDQSVPQELILGIIRRESAFHETIFSFAGAKGLMQLMPSTAADLARRNRLKSWNLLEADDNILLGTLYLHWLRERPWTSTYVDVLAAYNGGGGNLRSWKRRLGYKDADLFIQSIPFKETRDYVRKVIVAAASYRYLDTGAPPGRPWLEQFYRSF